MPIPHETMRSLTEENYLKAIYRISLNKKLKISPTAIADEMGVEEESIRTIKYRCMMKLRAVRNVIRGEENEAS